MCPCSTCIVLSLRFPHYPAIREVCLPSVASLVLVTVILALESVTVILALEFVTVILALGLVGEPVFSNNEDLI